MCPRYIDIGCRKCPSLKYSYQGNSTIKSAIDADVTNGHSVKIYCDKERSSSILITLPNTGDMTQKLVMSFIKNIFCD